MNANEQAVLLQVMDTIVRTSHTVTITRPPGKAGPVIITAEHTGDPRLLSVAPSTRIWTGATLKDALLAAAPTFDL